MPVAKLEPALEVVVISWRMGACETMVVEVGVWTRPEADRGGFTPVLDEETVAGICLSSMVVRTGR